MNTPIFLNWKLTLVTIVILGVFGGVMATAFKRRLETDNSLSDNDVQAQMAYLKAAAAYAAMRGQREELVRFFTTHANSIKGRLI